MSRLGNIINSRKEIVDSTLLAVAAATPTQVPIATVVNDYTGAVGTVPVGTTIKSVYLFVQGISDGTGIANIDWFIMKSPDIIVNPIPGATGGNTGRKYILHEEKGIPGNNSDGAYPATFKGVIRIPRGRQRMAEGDSIIIAIRGTDISSWCIKAIYKVFL